MAGRCSRPGGGFLRAIDGSTGRELRRVALDPSSSPDRVAISPDGKALAVLMTFRRQLRRQKDLSILVLVDADTLVVRWRIEKDHPYAGELAFFVDGRVLAIAGPAEGARTFNMMGPKASTIRLLDVAGGAEVRRIPVEGFGVGSLAFSPDGRTLAPSGGVDMARIWDVATGREVDHRPGHPGSIHSLVVSPVDGTVFTSGNGDGLILHWDPADGRSPGAVGVKPSMVDSLAISTDGGTLFVSDPDGGPVLWDVAGRRELRRLTRDRTEGGERYVHVVFSPDGRTATAGNHVWSDLASDDAPRAYRASWTLSAQAAVRFLRDQLRPAAANEPTAGPEVLRTLRAIAALERIGSPQAQEIPERLGRGDAGAPATQDATEALLRLSRKKIHLPGSATAR